MKEKKDAVLILRLPQSWLDYLDSKGNRSQVARDIIEAAKRRDEERKKGEPQ